MKAARELQVTTPSDREVAITRVFDAPRALVFDTLTKPELIKRWLSGPPGWSMETCTFEARVGGTYRYVWRGPEGVQMGMRGVVQEIMAPERVVATEVFDEAWYPGEAVDTTVLVEKAGRTTLTITVLYDSKETRDAVLKTPMTEGMEAGYGNLDTLLASLSAPDAK
jgi:uncharacterized protein YndB with AHSA1/START domain